MIRLLLATLLVAAAWPSPAAAVEDEVRFALLVSHDDGGPGTAQLLFSERDADRLADVLIQLGGVSPGRIVQLRAPTASAFRRALARLGGDVARAKAAGSHVSLLFYYSGHADPDALRLGRETVPFDALRADLEATGADARLLFLDSCFSGGASRAKGASRAPGFLREATASADARGEVLITSSAADEASQESNEVGGSYFTHYLVSGLRGDADASGDGAVTLDEAYRYVYHRTVAHTTGTRAGTQHPGFDYDLSGSGDVVLTDLGTRGAALSFGPADDGRFLIFDDAARRFVAEVQVLPGRPTRLLIEAGRYRVQRRGTDALHEQVVTLQTGDDHAVVVADMGRVPYADDVTKGHIDAYRRWRGRRGVVLSPKVGGQAYFDRLTRETLIPPLPIYGVEWAMRGFPGPLTSIRADVLFGVWRGKQELGSGLQDVQFFELHGSFGAFLNPPVPGTRVLRPFVGLKVGLLYLHREFAPVDQPAQDLVTATPGVVVGLEIAPTDRVSIAFEARAGFIPYIVEDEQKILGHIEPLVSLRFAL